MDQLAAIALQSWQELFVKDQNASTSTSTSRNGGGSGGGSGGWPHLKPVVDWYSKHNHNHSMPLEWFVGLWIPFWECHGYRAEALAWTLQVLRAGAGAVQEDALDATDATAATAELWIHCLSDQLPRLQDSNVARYLAQGLFVSNSISTMTMTMDSSSPSNFDSLQPQLQPQTNTMKVLLAVLENLPNELRSASIVESQRRLQQQVLLHTAKEDDDSSSTRSATSDGLVPVATTTTSIVGVVRSSNPYARRTTLGAWTAWIRQRLKQHCVSVSDWVVTNHSSNQQQQRQRQRQRQRGKIAFSLALALLAWRQKSLLTRYTRAVLMTLLSPLTELIDALVGTTTTTTTTGPNNSNSNNSKPTSKKAIRQ
jgi:hypothetical protein